MNAPEVFVYADGDLLAAAAAARTITGLADAVASAGVAHLVVTGGGIGTKVLSALANAPARDAVDWGLVNFWWGDERFEATGDPERNETGARSALLDHIPADPARIHAIPGPDGPDGDDPDAVAAAYAAALAAAAPATGAGATGAGATGAGATGAGATQAGAEDRVAVPSFDILMLGIGPEGHVASIFPDSAAASDERTVVAVRNSPKPPPTRISLTFPSIRAAREVWILAAGAEKAEAVATALSGAGPRQLPAAGARGTMRTLFLLDEAAAGKLPPGTGHPAAR